MKPPGGATDLSAQAIPRGVPEYATVANPRLTNAEFNGSQGWATTGQVQFATGSATLVEGAERQTRLNQVFVVNEGDRYLSFTVAGNLGDQASGPDDAFEVALLDANTGRALLTANNLTKSAPPAGATGGLRAGGGSPSQGVAAAPHDGDSG